MKHYFILAAAALMLASCTPKQDGYTIKGTVSGENEALKSGKAYLANRDRQDPIKDTADIVNGKFAFEGKVATPEHFYISVEGLDGQIGLFLENTAYRVSATDTALNEAIVTGGISQTIFNDFDKMSEELVAKYDLMNLMKEYRQQGTKDERKAEIEAAYDKYSEEMEQLVNKIKEENPFTHFSLYQFQQEYSEMPLDSAQTILNKYKEKMEFAGNKVIASIQKTLDKEKNLQVGNPSFDFTMNDPDGKAITFSDIYKANKVTMLDFWAGWCSPCRHFNPTLVKIYAQFHKKGFEILGVSMDRERQSWLDAIKADKLVWPQVSDVNYWECEPRHLYNVNYIPQNIFVDGNGTIIARRLAEDEIVPFLEERLNK